MMKQVSIVITMIQEVKQQWKMNPILFPKRWTKPIMNTERNGKLWQED